MSEKPEGLTPQMIAASDAIFPPVVEESDIAKAIREQRLYEREMAAKARLVDNCEEIYHTFIEAYETLLAFGPGRMTKDLTGRMSVLIRKVQEEK